MDAGNTISLIITLRAGICLFCATALLARRINNLSIHPLGLLFLCQGMTELPELALTLSTRDTWFATIQYIEASLIIANLISPFLLWLYVWELTREDAAQTIPKLWRHYVAVCGGICLVPLVFLIPPKLLGSTIEFPGTLTLQAQIGVIALVALDLFMTALVIVYLAAVIRRLRHHKTRLKDVFASTEDRELRWIWLIILFSVLYMLFDLTDVLELFTDTPRLQDFSLEVLQQLALFGLIWVIGLWGLRQQPAYAAIFASTEEERQTRTKPRYDNSALTEPQSSEIADKIKRAMQKDHLYRDPNLSLPGLSKHISTPSHYVSQTLNAQLGMTFFDYVNNLRVEDAKERLTTSQATVLAIAYDVGFNSRSSFYTAFKRETQQTPTEFRKRS